MQTYSEARDVLKDQYKDNNFCAVISLATAFDWSAGKAHRLLKKKGREHGRGTPMGVILSAMNTALEMTNKKSKMESYFKHERPTISQFCRMHKKGIYIVTVAGHILTVKDGVPQDWIDTTRRHRVQFSWHITEA